MKKTWVQTITTNGYEAVAPQTYADMVIMDSTNTNTLLAKITELEARITSLEARPIPGASGSEPVKLVISATKPPVEENALWVKPT